MVTGVTSDLFQRLRDRKNLTVLPPCYRRFVTGTADPVSWGLQVFPVNL